MLRKPKGLKQIISRCPDFTHYNRRIYLSLTDSSVIIHCDVFVNEIDKRKPTFDYLCSETLRIFAENNIEIPFNMMEVNIKIAIRPRSPLK